MRLIKRYWNGNASRSFERLSGGLYCMGGINDKAGVYSFQRIRRDLVSDCELQVGGVTLQLKSSSPKLTYEYCFPWLQRIRTGLGNGHG